MNHIEEFYSRNHFYIEPPLQTLIAQAKIAFLGVGLASTLAEVMVRTGFTQFILCDGDRIEHSNLNRQNFRSKDIGQNKAKALKKRLTAINKEISCRSLEMRMETLNQIEEVVAQADIIINTIDCGSLYFDLIETYRKRNKLVICPFNPGFGGLVVCFTENSSSAFDFFETETPCDDVAVARCLLQKPGVTIAAQVGKKNEDFFKALADKGFFPQLAIGAALTAALATTAAVDYLKKGAVPAAPHFSYTSAHLNFSL